MTGPFLNDGKVVRMSLTLVPRRSARIEERKMKRLFEETPSSEEREACLAMQQETAATSAKKRKGACLAMDTQPAKDSIVDAGLLVEGMDAQPAKDSVADYLADQDRTLPEGMNWPSPGGFIADSLLDLGDYPSLEEYPYTEEEFNWQAENDIVFDPYGSLYDLGGNFHLTEPYHFAPPEWDGSNMKEDF